MKNDQGASAHTPGPWACFHCGEAFTDEGCARLHFGRDEGSTVACILKGAEGGLLRALREAEEQADDAIQMMHSESTDAARAYHSQRCRHSRALMDAEEAGYERGLYDSGRSELLEALQNIADANNCPFNLAVHARAAIAKARGEASKLAEQGGAK